MADCGARTIGVGYYPTLLIYLEGVTVVMTTLSDDVINVSKYSGET